MDTIKINNKTFVVRKGIECCHKCLFYHLSNYPNSDDYCRKVDCRWFIVIREVNVIDKIRMWLKKNIKL